MFKLHFDGSPCTRRINQPLVVSVASFEASRPADRCKKCEKYLPLSPTDGFTAMMRDFDRSRRVED